MTPAESQQHPATKLVRVKLLRCCGVRLSDKDFADAQAIEGELSVAYVGNSQLASLRDPARKIGPRLVPELYQVQLEGITGDYFVLRGVERIKTESGEAAVAQEWRCEVC